MEDFVKFFRTLKKADKVLLEVIRIEEIRTMIPNLLSVHLTQEQLRNPNAPAWTNDNELVKTALEVLTTWLTKVMPHKQSIQQWLDGATRHWHTLMTEKDAGLAAQLRDEIQKDFPHITASQSVNGTEVLINMQNHNTVLHLSWEDPATNIIMHLKDFFLPAECRPTFPGDKRYIYLLPHGIDILDDDGVSMAVANTGKLCTLPLGLFPNTLQDMAYKDAFIALWERETECIFTDQLAQLAAVQGFKVELSPKIQREKLIPARYFAGQKRPFNTKVKGVDATAKALRQEFPLAAGDSLWLLDRFLTVYYPKGGVIRLAAPENIEQTDSIWYELLE